jgi:hypothetical protein
VVVVVAVDHRQRPRLVFFPLHQLITQVVLFIKSRQTESSLVKEILSISVGRIAVMLFPDKPKALATVPL